MNAFRRITLWLTFILACLLPASALTPSAPENRIWEIFSIGYDAATTEVADLGSRTETSTSAYDTAPIHSATTGTIPTETNRSLFGQAPEFKAAEGGGQFFIQNGVRRSLSSALNNADTIPAVIVREGQADEAVTLKLDQLFSPKSEVPLDSRFLDIQPPIRTPIEVQPLGVPGQPPSIPLNQVRLVPPPRE